MSFVRGPRKLSEMPRSHLSGQFKPLPTPGSELKRKPRAVPKPKLGLDELLRRAITQWFEGDDNES